MAEPITTAVVQAYLGKKGVDYLVKTFGKVIVERWSRKRAINFFGAFVEAVGEGVEEIDIATKLDSILESENNQEVLFEAYRLVCLTKSREIGPRAIALLTAQIVLEGRQVKGIEEPWFQVYEAFSDDELLETYEWYAKCFKRAESDDEKDKDYKIVHSLLTIEWSSQLTEFKEGADRDPMNFNECLGSWAQKLQNLSIIRGRVTERIWDYPEDSEQYVDEPGTARRITHWIDMNAFDMQFASIIYRAHKMVPIVPLL